MDAFKLLTMFGLLYVTFGYQITRDQEIKEERNEVECPPGYLCTKIENKGELKCSTLTSFRIIFARKEDKETNPE